MTIEKEEKKSKGGRPRKCKPKRMGLSLPPPVHDALMRFSLATGVPAAAYVTSILVDNLPTLELLANAAEDAKRGNVEQVKKTVAQALGTVILSQQEATKTLFADVE